ncbi:hypothetical protein NOGI109294_07820 [Nocardiopsis gilva]
MPGWEREVSALTPAPRQPFGPGAHPSTAGARRGFVVGALYVGGGAYAEGR